LVISEIARSRFSKKLSLKKTRANPHAIESLETK
jgi:hypothetical protein